MRVNIEEKNNFAYVIVYINVDRFGENSILIENFNKLQNGQRATTTRFELLLQASKLAPFILAHAHSPPWVLGGRRCIIRVPSVLECL